MGLAHLSDYPSEWAAIGIARKIGSSVPSAPISSGYWTSPTFRPGGDGCVAFVIEVFARHIVGWRVCTSMKLTWYWMPRSKPCMHVSQGLIHHCDRGSQYVSIRYSKRLAEAGVEPSVGSKVELPRGRGTGHLPGRTGTKMSSS